MSVQLKELKLNSSDTSKLYKGEGIWLRWTHTSDIIEVLVNEDIKCEAKWMSNKYLLKKK